MHCSVYHGDDNAHILTTPDEVHFSDADQQLIIEVEG